MTLQQLFNALDKKSYFSRDEDEIWLALNNACLQLYTEILAENSGFFIVWDTTSVSLIPNQEEYVLPQAVSQLVRVRERLLATDPWRLLSPSNLNDPEFVDAQFSSVLGPDQDGPVSDFEYYGPYLDMAGAQTQQQIEKIRIAPIPQDQRYVELVYTAKFLEIAGPGSTMIIPMEGHAVVLYLAMAELLGSNDDQNPYFATGGGEKKTQFLKWVRLRQIQKGRSVEPYVQDLD